MLEFQILFFKKRFTNSGLSFRVSVWVSNSIGKFPNCLLLSTLNFVWSSDAQSIANVLQHSLPVCHSLGSSCFLQDYSFILKRNCMEVIIVPTHSSSTENWREQYLNYRQCYENDKPQVPVQQFTWAPDPRQGCSETSYEQEGADWGLVLPFQVCFCSCLLLVDFMRRNPFDILRFSFLDS